MRFRPSGTLILVATLLGISLVGIPQAGADVCTRDDSGKPKKSCRNPAYPKCNYNSAREEWQCVARDAVLCGSAYATWICLPGSTCSGDGRDGGRCYRPASPRPQPSTQGRSCQTICSNFGDDRICGTTCDLLIRACLKRVRSVVFGLMAHVRCGPVSVATADIGGCPFGAIFDRMAVDNRVDT